MRGQEAGGKKKDGERKKTKPYTTIPSRGFALGKLPLDRPHQGAVMLCSYVLLPILEGSVGTGADSKAWGSPKAEFRKSFMFPRAEFALRERSRSWNSAPKI